MGFGVWGLGFGVWGLGFGVWGGGLGVGVGVGVAAAVAVGGGWVGFRGSEFRRFGVQSLGVWRAFGFCGFRGLHALQGLFRV